MLFLGFLLVTFVSADVILDPKLSEESGQPGNSKKWGEHIEWYEDLDEGIEKAKELKKPAMLVIHRTWCHACLTLAPKFAQSKEIGILSKYFVMISISAENEPWQEEYSPNGASYIPRMLFLNSDGSVIEEVQNTDPQYKEHYKHFFPETTYVVKAMLHALKVKGIKVKEDIPKESYDTAKSKDEL